MTLREDKVLQVLRKADPALARKLTRDISVHDMGNDSMVQVGTRVVVEGVTFERAMEEAVGQEARFLARGIKAKVKVFRE